MKTDCPEKDSRHQAQKRTRIVKVCCRRAIEERKLTKSADAKPIGLLVVVSKVCWSWSVLIRNRLERLFVRFLYVIFILLRILYRIFEFVSTFAMLCH